MNIFIKKMTAIADVFPKLRTPKNVVKKVSKNSRFRGRFDKQHDKGHQQLLKSELHYVPHLYCSLWRQLNLRKTLLVIFKLFGMFVNIFSVDGKYSLLNRDNLRQPIQMQLSRKFFCFQDTCIWIGCLKFS